MYAGVVDEDTMSDNSKPQNSSGYCESLNKATTPAASTPTGRTVLNEKQDDFQKIEDLPNADHTYCITPLSQDKPLHHLYHQITQHAMNSNISFSCFSCKIRSMHVKRLTRKLSALIAQHNRKPTSEVCIQTDPIAENDNQIKQSAADDEKEIHKRNVLSEPLRGPKSEQGTTQANEADIKNEMKEVIRQLDICANERDQYQCEVEKLKKKKLKMESKIRQLRTEVKQLKQKTQNVVSSDTASHKKNKRPSALESSSDPTKKADVTLVESDEPPNSNIDENQATDLNGAICKKRRITKSKLQNTAGPSNWLNSEMVRSTTTITDSAAINMKDVSSDYANFNTNRQGADEDYYCKHFKELSIWVKCLEDQIAMARVQQGKKNTSHVYIQTDPIPEPVQDVSRMQIVPQYEQVMKKLHSLKRLHNTLNGQVPGSNVEKEGKVKSNVNEMAIKADQVFRQLDACCTQRDLYKSEVNQLKQETVQIDSENSRLRTEVQQLRQMKKLKSSSDTSGNKSTQLRNLRTNVAKLLTTLMPGLNSPRIHCDDDDDDTIDGILQQVLEENEK